MKGKQYPDPITIYTFENSKLLEILFNCDLLLAGCEMVAFPCLLSCYG